MAQYDAHLTGHVLDETTGEHLPYVNAQQWSADVAPQTRMLHTPDWHSNYSETGLKGIYLRFKPFLFLYRHPLGNKLKIKNIAKNLHISEKSSNFARNFENILITIIQQWKKTTN